MSPEEFQTKFKNHVEARKALFEYYSDFKTAANDPIHVLKRTPSAGFSIGSSGLIHTSEEMEKNLRRCSELVTKMLGARFGDERQLYDLMQKAAHEAAVSSQPKERFFEAVSTDIVDIISQEFEIFLPNRLIVLQGRSAPLKIGNVRVLSLSDLEKELKSVVADIQTSHPDFSIHFDYEKHRAIFKQTGIDSKIPSSAMMWAVKACASKKNLHEEALWQIGIAISLVRLLSNSWDIRIPSLYDIEPNATSQDNYEGHGPLVLSRKALSFGDLEVSPIYIVDDKVSEDLRSNKSQAIFDAVFAHKPKTLGEQVYNALGWLTRGRQAIDRSERLLYFFTAIEAILTRNEKDRPVIDTIARYGSVMISASIEDRPWVAKQFKKLYTYRSDTVHRGMRNASADTVAHAHYLASCLTSVALQKGSLSVKHEKFSDSLSDASFGTDWKLKFDS